MKITRDQPQFTPITIVIETRDEADFIYELLNINGSHAMLDHLNKYYDIKSDMFNKICEVIT